MALSFRLSGDGMDHDSVRVINTPPLRRPLSTIPAKPQIVTSSVNSANYIPFEPVKGAIKRSSSNVRQADIINHKIDHNSSTEVLLNKTKESSAVAKERKVLHKSLTEPESFKQNYIEIDQTKNTKEHDGSNEIIPKTEPCNIDDGAHLKCHDIITKPDTSLLNASIEEREVEGQSSPDIERLQTELANTKAKLDQQIKVLLKLK